MMDYLQHLSEHIVPLVIGALLAAGAPVPIRRRVKSLPV